MTYIQHYDAPLGRILLAADEVGLTGLWFDSAKYFADGLPAEHTERETPVLSRPGAGWTFTLRGRSRAFCRRCTRLARRFSRRCGRCCCKFPTGRP